MEEGKPGTEMPEGSALERNPAAPQRWNDVIDLASKLSHLVQSGRHVSNEQLCEVNREVRGSGRSVKR